MTGITQFALEKSRLTILVLVAIVATGIFLFLDYPKREDPSLQVREGVVVAQFPGMSTERVEDLITRKIEEKIREMPEVLDIISDSSTGVSITHVVLNDQITEIPPVWQDLRNKMNDLRAELPTGTLGPVVNDEFGLTAVATVALWADGFSLAEMREVARTTRDRLYSLPGIQKIELYGVQEERIFLDLANAKLAQFGIGPGVIVDTLQSQNIILPGGNFEVAGQSLIIEPSGNFDAVSEIESVLIEIPGTQQVTPLADLVEISRGYIDPPRRPVFFNGHPAIVLSVLMIEGTNAVEFGARLTRRLREIESTLPWGYVLEYATFQPPLVEKAVFGAVNNVYQALAIVLIVVMVFLGPRTGLIVGSFVPVAMLLGIVGMWLLDIEMQRMSIATMIIALGLLVDNGIVVAEDIETRLKAGASKREAAIEAGRTLAIPLLTASLTTVLAFTPMMLAEGGTGEYTRSLGQVITIVLLGSWFLALFMTPSMCVWFMKQPAGAGQAEQARDPYAGRFYRAYRGTLEAVLRFRWLALALVLLALAGAVYSFRFVVQEFFPPSDRNQFLVYLDLPAGSRSDRTAEMIERLNLWLLDKEINPEVVSTVGYVGSMGPRFFFSLDPFDPKPHLGFMVVNVGHEDQVPALVERTRAQLLDRFPEVRGRVKAMWFGAKESGLVEIRISGPDAEVLLDKADNVIAGFRAIPGTLGIMHDWDNKLIKVVVEIDQARARRAGVTSEEVAQSLNAFVDGAEITDYREGERVIPVVLRGIEAERSNIYNLFSINVYSVARDTNVLLSQIAEFVPVWEYSKIKRRNQERTITVSARNSELKAGDLLAALRPTLDALELPPGYRWELGGELENSARAQGYLVKYMPACFGLIVVLLVWQFNSLRRPLIIVLTIPLTLVGVVTGLIVMDAVLGFMVMLGLLSLAGIIINNGIVLIDRIDSERAAGKAAYQAVVDSAVARFRPILMTTLTTILGLLPLIVSRDPLFYGMAVVMAFGLGIGTVLTLGVVPILYTLLFGVRTGKAAAAA